jgi:transposase-like protein
VTTDGHDAYPRSVREMLDEEEAHHCSRYQNNRMEQDHRSIKQRYYPMRGFGSFDSAARFCTGFEEQRQNVRAQARSGERVSLTERRRRFSGRWAAILGEMIVA